MAAAGSTPFVVRVKDVTGDVFIRAYVKLTLMVTDDTDVSDLKKAVRAAFKSRWRNPAEDDISLFLVNAAAGQKPNKAEEGAAIEGNTELDSVESLNVARLTSGCFVLAKCAVVEVADNSAGTPAGRDGGSVLSPSVHSGMVSLHSNKAEADASAVFLQLVHESFPLARVDYQDRLLTQTNRPVSNRIFNAAAFPDAFETARQAYCTATLDPPKSATKANVDSIDFSPAGHYTNRDYTHVEFDCIVKVPLADNAEWSRDPALTDGAFQRLFFIAPQGSLQSLPARPAPVVPEASSEGERQPSAGTRSAATSFSLEHYPPGATHYIVGEVYSPLGEGDVKPFQKLLQAERNLQFLKAKEGATDVRACILGFIFLGPHMSAVMGAKLYNTLKHYQTVLPFLWKLQQTPCRLLGCTVTPFQPAIAHLEVLREVRDLSGNLLREVHASIAEQKAAVEKAVEEQRAAVEKAVEEQRAAFTALSAKLDSALAVQRNRGE